MWSYLQFMRNKKHFHKIDANQNVEETESILELELELEL